MRIRLESESGYVPIDEALYLQNNDTDTYRTLYTVPTGPRAQPPDESAIVHCGTQSLASVFDQEANYGELIALPFKNHKE